MLLWGFVLYISTKGKNIPCRCLGSRSARISAIATPTCHREYHSSRSPSNWPSCRRDKGTLSATSELPTRCWSNSWTVIVIAFDLNQYCSSESLPRICLIRSFFLMDSSLLPWKMLVYKVFMRALKSLRSCLKRVEGCPLAFYSSLRSFSSSWMRCWQAFCLSDSMSFIFFSIFSSLLS